MSPAFALTGVVPILAMPFTRELGIDEESLRREVDWAIGHGVDGLALALGSDFPRLTPDERSRATRICAEQAAARVPLVVHVAAESGTAAAELARRAAADGAAALMVLPPTFDAPGADGIRDYFLEVAAAVELPIVLQDTPAAHVPWAAVHALVERLPGRLALKAETDPTPDAVQHAVSAFGDRLPVFGGNGGVALISELARGASGTMPGCALPERFAAVWRAHRDGDRVTARQRFAPLAPYLCATGVPGRWLAFYRETLVLRGVFAAGHARSPQAALSPAERRELRELLDDLEIDITQDAAQPAGEDPPR
jgi:2-keto-3-deoxy-L-arabinonate dehydratase